MSHMIIKQISATDFKGASNVSYEFGPNLNIMLGPNGSGKTTVADAYLYGVSARDYAMTANPAITPLFKAADACDTKVVINAEIDGKPIEIIRSQKTRLSKPDVNGVRKVTTINTYTINSVAMSERDAIKRFAEYGIDMDIFFVLSHPEVLVSQAMGDKKSSDKARALVSAMANPIPDYEIALKAGTVGLAKMLENYTVEEVAEMQKATRRKILAEYGKKGEILQAAITSAESMRVPYDADEIARRKAELEADKAKYSEELKAASALRAKKDALVSERTEVNAELVRNRQEANKDNINALFAIRQKIADKREEVRQAESAVETDRAVIAALDTKITSLKADLGSLAETLTNVKARTFDESSTVCPVCGREYPAEKASEIKAEFDSHKAKDIQGLEQRIAQCQATINKYTANRGLGEKVIEADKKTAAKCNAELLALLKEKEAIPENLPDEQIPGYAEAMAKIEAINAEIAKVDTSLAEKEQAKVVMERITESVREIERREASAKLNEAVDAKIATLREQQKVFEQMIADTEKMEAEIATFGRAKNEMLTDSINSHFKVTKWKLFDYQKNGEYKPCLIPTMAGTPYTALSGGEKLIVMADIVTSLQTWYDTYLPVFIDEAGIATRSTLDRVKSLANTQLILLTAKDTEGGRIIVEHL